MSISDQVLIAERPLSILVETTRTLTKASLPLNPDVTALSPTSSPRVLQLPEEIISFLPIADNDHAMIHTLSTSSFDDTATIVAKRSTVKRNSNWLLSDGSLDGVVVVFTGKSEVVDLVHKLGWVGVTITVPHRVRVVRKELNSIAGHVFKAIVVGTSAAAPVAWNTVDQLLHGEVGETVPLDSLDTLDGGSSGEGPTPSAAELVLDGGDGSSGSPVDGGWKPDCAHLGRLGGARGRFEVTGVSGLELGVSQIRELVDSKSVGMTLSVVGVDHPEVLVKDRQSVVVLGWGRVQPVMRPLPLLELCSGLFWDLSLLGFMNPSVKGDSEKDGDCCDGDCRLHLG